MSKNVVVLISGTGSNLKALIDGQHNHNYTITGVVADRQAPGLAFADEAGIKTRVVKLADYDTRADWDEALAKTVSSFKPDLVVLAGFMKLVGSAMLNAFSTRMINTHPALLPSFPGDHAVADALAHGVKITGATVFIVDEGIDTGRIIAQRAVEVLDGDTEDSLHERIKQVEHQMLVEVVANF